MSHLDPITSVKDSPSVFLLPCTKNFSSSTRLFLPAYKQALELPDFSFFFSLAPPPYFISLSSNCFISTVLQQKFLKVDFIKSLTLLQFILHISPLYLVNTFPFLPFQPFKQHLLQMTTPDSGTTLLSASVCNTTLSQ